jgi:hypothetical protein
MVLVTVRRIAVAVPGLIDIPASASLGDNSKNISQSREERSQGNHVAQSRSLVGLL